MTGPEVTVVGLGPAGRALAHRLASRGVRVRAVDPDPGRRWHQTFGGWERQLPPWLPAEVRGVTPRTTVLRTQDEHPLPDRYVILDTGRLQDALSLDGVDVVAGNLDDADLRALGGPVVDCRGSRPTGQASGRVPAQTALGVVLDAAVAEPVLAGADAVLMDWTTPDGAATWGGVTPTFCYTMPLPGGGVLVEETCLAGRPAPGLAALSERLRTRLARHGVDPARVDDAPREEVFIPMLPAPVRHPHARLGTAGDQLNPISGYSVFASLAAADALAGRVAVGVTTPRALRTAPRLRQVALGALVRLSGDATVELFDAFGRLPADDQRAVLDPTTPPPDLLRALLAQWLRMPPSGRAELVRATAGLPRPRASR